MRLAIALAGALVLHGAVFGLGLALLPRDARRPPAVALDVDLVPARPDPVAVLRPPVPSLAPPSHPARHLRPSSPARAFRPALTRGPAPPAPAVVSPAALSAPAGIPAGAHPAAVAAPAGVPAGAHPVAAATPVESLSAQPRYRTNPAPEYPTAARRLREEGVVLVRVAVAADGRPTAVTVQHSCGHPLLDDAAVEAVRRWTFEPARAAGTSVASLVVVPVRFALTDAP